MVDVLGDHRLDVAFPPFGEAQAVVEFAFAGSPYVEGLVHDQHSEAVAGIQHRLAHRGWCDMRIALNPASLSNSTRRCSARAIVAAPRTPLSWWTRAAQFHGLVVDPHTPFRVESQRPDPESGGVYLKASFGHRYVGGVQGGRVQAPQRRATNVETVPGGRRLTGQHRDLRGLGGGEVPAPSRMCVRTSTVRIAIESLSTTARSRSISGVVAAGPCSSANGFPLGRVCQQSLKELRIIDVSSIRSPAGTRQ